MHHWIERLSMLVIFGALSACAAPRHEMLPSKVSPSSTRLTIERNDEIVFMALGARVRVNGQEHGLLYRNDKIQIDVQPGQSFISVDSPSSHGAFEISAQLKSGLEYYLEISPNSFGYSLGIIGAIAESATGMNSLASAGSVDFAVQKNGGSFKILPKRASSPNLRTEHNSDTQMAPATKTQIGESGRAKIADSLKELKDLHDSGLISTDVYKERQREILTGK